LGYLALVEALLFIVSLIIILILVELWLILLVSLLIGTLSFDRILPGLVDSAGIGGTLPLLRGRRITSLGRLFVTGS